MKMHRLIENDKMQYKTRQQNIIHSKDEFYSIIMIYRQMI